MISLNLLKQEECLQEMGQKLHKRMGIPVSDVLRFFYGDGPAAQFEAGHKQGGPYCCTGCVAQSGRFADIAYCYRAPKPTLKERQDFVLQGKARKRGGKHAIHILLHTTTTYIVHGYMYNICIYYRCESNGQPKGKRFTNI